MKKNRKQNIFPLLGMLIGVIAIIMGLVFLSEFTDNYGSLSSVTFGGDFYTEIHKVTRAAANRVGDLADMLGTAIAWVFILGGAIDICAFGSKLKAAPQEGKEETVPETDAE